MMTRAHNQSIDWASWGSICRWQLLPFQQTHTHSQQNQRIFSFISSISSFLFSIFSIWFCYHFQSNSGTVTSNHCCTNYSFLSLSPFFYVHLSPFSSLRIDRLHCLHFILASNRIQNFCLKFFSYLSLHFLLFISPFLSPSLSIAPIMCFEITLLFVSPFRFRMSVTGVSVVGNASNERFLQTQWLRCKLVVWERDKSEGVK